jgi:L-2-hydroxycarboxylate dehydrogenase (NAD+)
MKARRQQAANHKEIPLTNLVNSGLFARELQAQLEQLLYHWGVSSPDATITAGVLVEATLEGRSGHGVERILEMVAGFKKGTLVANSKVTILVDWPSLVHFDGGYGLGPPLAERAMRAAMKKAATQGCATAGTCNSGHIGPLGYYTALAAREGFVALAMTTSSPAMVVPGGNTALLGTNPIAISYPSNDGTVTADFSTSAIPRGTVLRARENGELLPEGVAVDARGMPTRDPEEALQGGLLPIGGGIKGMLLALAVSMFAGPLVGGIPNQDVTGTLQLDEPPTKSDWFYCQQIVSLELLKQQASTQLETMRRNSAAFHAPGAGSAARRKEALDKPILISSELAQLLREAGLL